MKIHFATVDIKSKKILSMMKVTNDEHIHDDSKMLPEFDQNIIKSNSATASKLFAIDGAYDSNEIFRYLSDKRILPCIKVRKRMLELNGKKKGTRLGICQLYLRRKMICKSGKIALAMMDKDAGLQKPYFLV